MNYEKILQQCVEKVECDIKKYNGEILECGRKTSS